MNTIIIFFAEYLIYIVSLYAIIYVLLRHEKKNYLKHIVIVLGTAVLAWVIAHFLKNVFATARPESSGTLIVPNSIYSFPSGHAAYMSALAFSVYGFDRRDGIIIFVLAVLSGITRVSAGVHFWYDILGGFVLGAIVSYLVLFFTKNLNN